MIIVVVFHYSDASYPEAIHEFSFTIFSYYQTTLVSDVITGNSIKSAFNHLTIYIPALSIYLQ
jgi:hypothetical protein